MIQFPLLNISDTDWSGDLSPLLITDQYLYNPSKEYFHQYLQHASFCDSHGDIYTVKQVNPPTAWWRKVFKFLPNVYKAEIVFRPTNKRMELEEFRNYVIDRINSTSDHGHNAQWIASVKSADSHGAIMLSEAE